MNLGEIAALVDGFDAPEDGAAMKSRELILGLLQQAADPLSRHHFTPGHITATGLVLAPSGVPFLLVHHARLDRWLLPGGHIEQRDVSAAGAAQREVTEETGAALDTAFVPVLISLDVHGIPPKRDEPYHLHHDLVFGFHALHEQVTCSPESRAVEWCGPDDFERYTVPSNVRLAYSRFR